MDHVKIVNNGHDARTQTQKCYMRWMGVKFGDKIVIWVTCQVLGHTHSEPIVDKHMTNIYEKEHEQSQATGLLNQSTHDIHIELYCKMLLFYGHTQLHTSSFRVSFSLISWQKTGSKMARHSVMRNNRELTISLIQLRFDCASRVVWTTSMINSLREHTNQSAKSISDKLNQYKSNHLPQHHRTIHLH